MLRFVGDAQALRAWVGRGIAQCVAAGCALVALLAGLALWQPRLALWTLPWLVLAGVMMSLTLPPLRRAVRECRRRQAGIATNVYDRIATLPLLQATGATARERRRLQRQNRQLRQAMQTAGLGAGAPPLGAGPVPGRAGRQPAVRRGHRGLRGGRTAGRRARPAGAAGAPVARHRPGAGKPRGSAGGTRAHAGVPGRTGTAGAAAARHPTRAGTRTGLRVGRRARTAGGLHRPRAARPARGGVRAGGRRQEHAAGTGGAAARPGGRPRHPGRRALAAGRRGGAAAAHQPSVGRSHAGARQRAALPATARSRPHRTRPCWPPAPWPAGRKPMPPRWPQRCAMAATT